MPLTTLPNTLPNEWIVFTVALFGSLLLTIPVRQLALRVGLVDHPGPRKVHQQPMPLLGGLAIYCGVWLALLFGLHGGARAEVLAIFAGGTLVAVVGILDDRGLLHHQIKLFGAMPAAAVILIVAGIRAHVFETVLPGIVGEVLDIALTLVWVVGITAAFSILDHMDGLCAGTAAIAAGFFALLASAGGQVLVSTLAAAVFGAALGFLRWNFNPARIFMGDGGAMFLGFLLATLGIKLRVAAPSPVVSWLVPVLVLAVPVFDTTLVSISRSRRGLIPFTSPGKDHTAHRLSNLGLRHRGAALALYGLGIAGGLAAWLLLRLNSSQAHFLAALLVPGVLAAVWWLERAPYERQSQAK